MRTSAIAPGTSLQIRQNKFATDAIVKTQWKLHVSVKLKTEDTFLACHEHADRERCSTGERKHPL